jgi:arylsulfatase A-like enzyme
MRNQFKLLLAVLAAFLITCGADEKPLNVLVIGIDTLRADHLGCYGYRRDTSPRIDQLASGGVLLERTVSQAPWTLPSFASIFTSLYPSQHGAATVDSRIRPSVPTLASILAGQGYLTAALVNAPLMQPEYGMATGFDFYDSPPPDSIRTAGRITEDALSWLGDNKKKAFFLFVHYFDPHLSYAPPAPFDRMFGGDYTGSIRGSFDLDYFSSTNSRDIRREIELLSREDRDRIVALYDGEIAFTDSAVGALLDGLRDLDLEQRTLVVLLSDHGEEFFDHGGLDHGHTLYDELLSVPLIFSLPGTLPAESRLEGQVRLIDVAPTILDILGLEPPAHFEGMSLRRWMTGGATKIAPDETGEDQTELMPPDESALLPQADAYAEALRRNTTQRCISSYPWKLILDTRTNERSLFNLEEDPGEQHSVSGTQPAVDHRLEQAIYRTLFAMTDSWYVSMVGGSAPHTFDISVRVGPDPLPGSIGFNSLLYPQGPAAAGARGITADAPGEILAAVQVEVSQSELRIRGLEARDTTTLAFTADPAKARVEFDLAIDGEPAMSRTLLGRSMEKPEAMPFSRVAGSKSIRSRGAPAGRAEPPYFLIWHSRSPFTGPSRISLNDGTKKALKALGYIQ